MTHEEELAIDTKIGALSRDEMQTRLDELDNKEELTEAEEYELDELEDHLDAFNVDDEEADADV